MSLVSNKARLSAFTKKLSVQWQETKVHWQDAKCGEFERKYLEELVTNVDTATEAIDHLDKLLTRIRSECE